jgi:hypothetical protein
MSARLSFCMIQFEGSRMNLNEMWYRHRATGGCPELLFWFPTTGGRNIADEQTSEVGSTIMPFTARSYNYAW